MDNKPDLQPPVELITLSGVGDPHEEVLSPSDIKWKEVEILFSYLGDNGEKYIVYVYSVYSVDRCIPAIKQPS